MNLIFLVTVLASFLTCPASGIANNKELNTTTERKMTNLKPFQKKTNYEFSNVVTYVKVPLIKKNN